MKNRKKPNKIDCVPIQNPVAKFAHQFNKAHVFEDKNKYHRNAKHRKQDTSLIIAIRLIRGVSCALGRVFANELQYLHFIGLPVAAF
jgi:hypothetical protein